MRTSLLVSQVKESSFTDAFRGITSLYQPITQLLVWLYVDRELRGNFFVLFLQQNSPVAGPRGFSVGSRLRSINGCPLLTGDDWGRCLSAVVFYPQSGYCQQIGKIKEKDNTVQCETFILVDCFCHFWRFFFEDLVSVQFKIPLIGPYINYNIQTSLLSMITCNACKNGSFIW